MSGWKTPGATANSAVTVNVCGAPARFVALGDAPSRNLTHVLVAPAGRRVGGRSRLHGDGHAALPVPSSSDTVIAPGVTVTAPGSVEVTVTVHVPPVVPVAAGVADELRRIAEADGERRPVGHRDEPGAVTRSCCTVIVNGCEVPARFVALGEIVARYAIHVFVVVPGVGNVKLTVARSAAGSKSTRCR